MTSATRRHAADVLIALAVGSIAFLFRFNTLGGALGGFADDEFGYLSRARQIQAGEVPFRDFNDPGWFLTDYTAAFAQWLGGFNLRSEAVLTVGMLSLGAALTYWLARQLTGSRAAALAGVALQIALDPRHYNYPKVVFYAIGLACAWAYVANPRRSRLVLLAAVVAVAFLFRHDHFVYLGALGVMTIAIVHMPAWERVVRDAAAFAVLALVSITPFLGFLALNGGVGEYFRAAFVYVSRDATRTSFRLPRFTFDPSAPLIALTRPEDTRVRVNVRWGTAADTERREREARYGLHSGRVRDSHTVSYELSDTSRGNIEALVRDPFVADTHGVNRATFTVAAPPTPEPRPLRLESQFDNVPNATAVLYYLLLALPLAAAAVLAAIWRTAQPTRVDQRAARLIPLIVLAALLNASFLSRGSTNIRLGDVGVTGALLFAWLLAALWGPDARAVVSRGVVRVAVRAALVLVLMVTALSANGLAQTWRQLHNARFTSGPVATIDRAAEVWTELSRSPFDYRGDTQPRLIALARYINACTGASDRLFVLGEHPELYYFSGRAFAGGHAWLLPRYYGAPADQDRIVARLRQARVPIVVTESLDEYDRDYRPSFPQLHEYLLAEYREAGVFATGQGAPLRILAKSDLAPSGEDASLGLPCFMK